MKIEELACTVTHLMAEAAAQGLEAMYERSAMESGRSCICDCGEDEKDEHTVLNAAAAVRTLVSAAFHQSGSVADIARLIKLTLEVAGHGLDKRLEELEGKIN